MRSFLLLLSPLAVLCLAKTTCFDHNGLSSWHAIASTPRKTSSKHGCAINLYFDHRANETVYVDMLVRHKTGRNECFARKLQPANQTKSTTYPVYMITCRCSSNLCNNVNLVLDSLASDKLPQELKNIRSDLEQAIATIKKEAKEATYSMVVWAGVVSFSLALAVLVNVGGMAVVLVKDYAG